jgi:predicted MPP superfamily phosphohydrolase
VGPYYGVFVIKVRYVSDLHFEIPGNNFVPEWIKGSRDEILVVAGDTLPVRYALHHPLMSELLKAFIWQCSGFAKVIFILGNHDHYHWELAQTYNAYKYFLYTKVGVSDKQYLILENQTIPLTNEYDLFGATLWTDIKGGDPLAMINVVRGMRDYELISTSPDVPLEPEDTIKEHNITMVNLGTATMSSKKFIIATHHCPHYKSLGERHKATSTINDGYCSDLSEFILDRPNITNWICGHTHSDVEYEIGSCKIHMFPRGYLGRGEGKNFTEEEFKNRFIEI